MPQRGLLWRLGLVFGVALVVRLVYLFQIKSAAVYSVLLGDGARYDEWAREISGGDWVGQEVFYQAPLYPYFLGLIYSMFGESITAARVVQVVLGAIACVLLADAGRRWFSPRVGLLAGLGLALYAPAIFFDGLIQKSILDGFLICLALWIMSRQDERPARWGGWVGLGVTLAALMLTRENALLFVPVILAWIVLRFRPQERTRLAFAAVFLAGMGMVLLPVAIRNQVVGGEFYLTTSQFGPNFYIGNNAEADGTYKPLRQGRGSAKYEQLDAKLLAESDEGRELSPSEVSRYWTGRAIKHITSEPTQWLGLMVRKFTMLWYAREIIDTDALETYAESSWLLNGLRFVTHFGVLLPLATLGLVLGWSRWREMWSLYALILVYAAGILMFYVVARYRFPLVPFFVLFAAFGVSRGFQGIATVSRGRQVVAVIATITVALFSNWPGLIPGVGDLSGRMRAVTETNLGTVLMREGKIDEALVHLERALEADPKSFAALSTYGDTLRRTGDLERAEEMLTRAVALAPRYAPALAHLASVRHDQERYDEAIDLLEQARLADPLHESIYTNLGNALAALGRVDEAEAQYREAIRLKPDATSAYYNLGLLYARSGRPAEAERAIRQSLDLYPDNIEAMYNLGLLMRSQRRYDEAITVLEQALVYEPEHYGSLAVLGASYGSSGRHADAAAIYKRMLQISQEFDEAHFNLGNAYNMMGQPENSLRHLREALRLRPGVPFRMAYLAGMLATHADESIRDPEEAIKIAEQAAMFTERRDSYVLDTLAAAYGSAGRFEEAINTVDEALELVRAAGQDGLIPDMVERQTGYREGRPFIAPVRP